MKEDTVLGKLLFKSCLVGVVWYADGVVFFSEVFWGGPFVADLN